MIQRSGQERTERTASEIWQNIRWNNMDSAFTAISRLWKQLWCNDCAVSYSSGCPVHGELNVIQDEYVPPRAISSLPNVFSMVQQDDSKTISIYATTTLSKGTRLGPVDGERQEWNDTTSLEDKWVVFNTNGPSVSIQQNCLNTSNWTVFLSQSEDRNLCNLVVYQHMEDLFLVTNREIQPGEKLLFEYSESYKTCQQLASEVICHIPMVHVIEELSGDNMSVEYETKPDTNDDLQLLDNQSTNNSFKGKDNIPATTETQTPLKDTRTHLSIAADVSEPSVVQSTKDNIGKLNQPDTFGKVGRPRKPDTCGRVGRPRKTNPCMRGGKISKSNNTVSVSSNLKQSTCNKLKVGRPRWKVQKVESLDNDLDIDINDGNENTLCKQVENIESHDYSQNSIRKEGTPCKQLKYVESDVGNEEFDGNAENDNTETQGEKMKGNIGMPSKVGRPCKKQLQNDNVIFNNDSTLATSSSKQVRKCSNEDESHVDKAAKEEVDSIPSYKTRHIFPQLMGPAQEVNVITVVKEELKAMADDQVDKLVQAPVIVKDPSAPDHNPARHRARGLIGWHLNMQAPHYKYKEIYRKIYEGVKYQMTYKTTGTGVYEIHTEIICNHPNDTVSNLLLYGETKKPEPAMKAAYSKISESINIDMYEMQVKHFKNYIQATDHRSSVINRDGKCIKVHDFSIEPAINEDLCYICFICSPIRIYPQQNCAYYRRHVKYHFKDLVCEQCGEKFKRKNGLKKHIRVHHTVDRPKNYKCDMCVKAFRTPTEMNQHRKNIHDPNRERPLCPECGKTFSNVNILKRHLLTHLDIRPYECNICTRKFTQSGDLKIHKEKIHVKGSIRFQPVHYLELAKKRLSQLNSSKNSTVIYKDMPSLSIDTSVRHIDDLSNDSSVRQINGLPNDTSMRQIDGLPNDTSMRQTEDLPNDTSMGQIDDLPNDTTMRQIDDLPNDISIRQMDDLPNDTSVRQIDGLLNYTSMRQINDLNNENSLRQINDLPDDHYHEHI
ncbi:unnamed protein product [Owenia fusiformis]|uniref:Uncharacterized protein n=1 Tax=Owenia fusiformis TaxID=6347 RepID=A0A8J1T7T2_OWEFU|nr:unnamed protein product [Owenia fusiformis]